MERKAAEQANAPAFSAPLPKLLAPQPSGEGTHTGLWPRGGTPTGSDGGFSDDSERPAGLAKLPAFVAPALLPPAPPSPAAEAQAAQAARAAAEMPSSDTRRAPQTRRPSLPEQLAQGVALRVAGAVDSLGDSLAGAVGSSSSSSSSLGMPGGVPKLSRRPSVSEQLADNFAGAVSSLGVLVAAAADPSGSSPSSGSSAGLGFMGSLSDGFGGFSVEGLSGAFSTSLGSLGEVDTGVRGASLARTAHPTPKATTVAGPDDAEAQAPAEAPAATSWQQAVAADGALYYYNPATGETRWEPPSSSENGGVASSGLSL
jgi:hypothetical protein